MARQNYTRTVNPLQFEALEPKRFEDLVRQLLYDFRPWRQLEATGRAGSDDGFDARGWEIDDRRNPQNEADDEDPSPPLNPDRAWLIQCKRERAIGPTKIIAYLNAIPEPHQLHGLIIAACCDFSKKTRDAFRDWCAARGIQEFYLWGRAELEDTLFLPRNDHLLFAYFGLSLTIRRRSKQSLLRSQMTIKRKLRRMIDLPSNAVVLRDSSNEDYPYIESGKSDFRWWVHASPKLTHRGLECRREVLRISSR